MPQEELERDIYATGFFRQKAKSLRGTARMLLEEFDGQVPRTMPELLRLPGVARKTANVVAAELGNPQGVVVDTHVRRLSQRLGLTKQRGSGEDRARPRASSCRGRLGPLPAPPDLARPPRLRRAAAALRGVRRQRPLPVEPRRGARRYDRLARSTATRDRGVRAAELPGLSSEARARRAGRRRRRTPGKTSTTHRLHLSRARAQLELLAEPPHAPLERERDRVLPVREAAEAEGRRRPPCPSARSRESRSARRRRGRPRGCGRLGRRRSALRSGRGSSRPSARRGSRSRSARTRPPAAAGPGGRRVSIDRSLQFGQMKYGIEPAYSVDRRRLSGQAGAVCSRGAISASSGSPASSARNRSASSAA